MTFQVQRIQAREGTFLRRRTGGKGIASRDRWVEGKAQTRLGRLPLVYPMVKQCNTLTQQQVALD